MYRRPVLSLVVLAAVVTPPPLDAQAPRWRPLFTIGSDQDDRTRLAQLHGLASSDNYLLRTPLKMATPLSGDTARLRWALLIPEYEAVYNSAVPFSLNDGAMWAGRGWNQTARAGLVATWKRVSLTLAPELLVSENLPYEGPPPIRLGPLPPGRDPLSSPWHTGPSSIDLPLRFGFRGFVHADPGESSFSVDWGAVTTGLATEHEVEVPGIVEMRQIVGHRECFCTFQQKRVVERDGRRLEQHPHRPEHDGRQPRIPRRGLAIEANQRADASAAATQREGHHARDGLILNSRVATQIRGDEFFAPLHDPGGDGVNRRPHVGFEPPIGQDRQLSGEIRGDQCPAGCGHPRGGSIDDELRGPRRLERRVDRPDDVEQRIAALDPPAQRTLKDPQPRRQIEPAATRWELSRGTKLRSPLASTLGAIQADRWPTRAIRPPSTRRRARCSTC